MEVVSFEKFALSEEDIQGGVLGSEMASMPRSEGLHWSSVVRYMSSKKYKKGTEPSSWYRETGFIWEMMLEYVFKQRMKHHRRHAINQLSFEVDDIYMTPDGLVFDGPQPGPEAMLLAPPSGVNTEDYIEEYKATWRSMKNIGVAPGYTEFFVEFEDWHRQVMGYCRAAQVTRADFYVLFINGDYKPMIPDACYISVRYTPTELEENWEMGLNNSQECR